MEHPADRPAPLPRWLLPVAVVVAIVATLATTTVALGASTRLAAACDGVSLRTKPSTSSAVVVRISAGVRVTAVDRVRGGRWTTRCKGSLVAGHGWYRITVVRQKTVREKYGRRYLYAAVGLFRKVPIAGTTAPAPTPTPTPSPTPSPTEAAIAPTPTPSLAPPPEASATSTPSGTPAAPTPTPTPTATATPTATPTPTPTSTPAPTPTPPASGVVTLPSSVTFYGRGWGHGVGLSQYGAYGRAKAGESAKTILAHYYAKTSIGTIANPQVRVLVLDDYGATATNPATFYGRNGPWTIDGIDGTFPADARLRLVPTVKSGVTTWKAIVDAADGSRLYAGATSGNLRLRPASDATTLQVWSKPSARDTYRGVLHVVAATTVDVVNLLPMESYLRGVVPAEVPSSWPRAALRAQAIAARSYAAYALHPGSGRYDVHDDTRSQVYVGVLGERTTTDAAVADTADQVVITGSGAVADTLFHSSDGGWTENNENVYVSSTGAKVAGPVSYLRGVSDRAADGSSFDAASPYATWRTGTYSLATIQSIFSADSRTDVGSVVALDLSNRGVSGRLVSVTLIGSTGTRKTVSGEVFIGVFNARRPAGDPIIRSTLLDLSPIP